MHLQLHNSKDINSGGNNFFLMDSIYEIAGKEGCYRIPDIEPDKKAPP